MFINVHISIYAVVVINDRTGTCPISVFRVVPEIGFWSTRNHQEMGSILYMQVEHPFRVKCTQ